MLAETWAHQQDYVRKPSTTGEMWKEVSSLRTGRCAGSDEVKTRKPLLPIGFDMRQSSHFSACEYFLCQRDETATFHSIKRGSTILHNYAGLRLDRTNRIMSASQARQVKRARK